MFLEHFFEFISANFSLHIAMVQQNNESQVRRSIRLQIKKETARLPTKKFASVVGLKKPAKSGKRPRNIEIPSSSVGISSIEEPIISLNDHHVSVPECDPMAYFPPMSGNVEAGFERIFCLKDNNRNQFWATGRCKPLDVVFDGLSTCIMREVMSVLRPETSSAHNSMEHLSFLTQDDCGKPFLQALNGCDKSTTASLMHSNDYETMVENMKDPVFLHAIDVGNVANALHNMSILEAGSEMAAYVKQLAASVQRIKNAPEVHDKDKLLWISVIRLFFVSAIVTIGLGPYLMLGEFISGDALNTTLSLALGKHTRAANCIDLWLLKAVYEKIAAHGDPTGRFLWVRVFDANADLILKEVVGDPSYCTGFGDFQNTGSTI